MPESLSHRAYLWYFCLFVTVLTLVLIFETNTFKISYIQLIQLKEDRSYLNLDYQNSKIINTIYKRGYRIGTKYIMIKSKRDFATLVNLTPFRFYIFNKVCKKKMLFLIVVHSSPKNINKRNTIRTTWGANQNIKVVFVLGAVESLEDQELLEKENEDFQDILQGNFVDHYRNLTYKHVMGLKYVVYYCPQVSYLVKVNDDVFINVALLEIFLKNKLQKCGDTNLLQCRVLYDNQVLRSDSDLKWTVQHDEYPNQVYSNYCLGHAIIYSWDIAYKLYKEAQRGDYFWIDDVYVTGILGKRIDAKHKELSAYVLNDSFVEGPIERYINEKPFIFGPPNLSADNITLLWMAINKMNQRELQLHEEDC